MISRRPARFLRRPHAPRGRDGLTLFEVVLATIILAGGLAVLSPMLSTMRLSLRQATLETEALSRAKNLIGVAVAEASVDAPSDQLFDSGDGWIESLAAVQTDPASRWLLTAVVQYVNDDGNIEADVTLERVLFVPAAEGT